MLRAALFSLAIGVIAFAAIALLTFSGWLDGFDESALLVFRSPDDLTDPIGSRTIEHFMRDLTALGGTFVLTLVTIVTVVYLLFDRRRDTAAYVAVAVALNAAANFLLKEVFARLRPAIMDADPAMMSPAFPSGHAQSSAMVYLTIALIIGQTLPQRWQRRFALCVAALLTLSIGISRVYRGVHWPTDVLAGWTLGVSWTLFCWFLYVYVSRRRGIQTAEPNRTPTPSSN